MIARLFYAAALWTALCAAALALALAVNLARGHHHLVAFSAGGLLLQLVMLSFFVRGLRSRVAHDRRFACDEARALLRRHARYVVWLDRCAGGRA